MSLFLCIRMQHQVYGITLSMSLFFLCSVYFRDAGPTSFFPDPHGPAVAARDAETPGEDSRTVHGACHHGTRSQAQRVSVVFEDCE